MRWLLPVLLIVTTVASGQTDPRPAADYVHQYAVYYGAPRAY